MRARQEAGRSKAAAVGLGVRIVWLLVVGLVAWVMLPSMAPEKVNVKNLRGAAKYQARNEVNDAMPR